MERIGASQVRGVSILPLGWIRRGQGFERVVLVGHSAGWSAVAAYEIQKHDARVAGMVLASGAVQVQRPERDAALMAEATRLVRRVAATS